MVATRPMTVAEFASTPHEGPWELIDGVPIEVSPSGELAGWTAGEMFGRLREHVRAHHLGRAYSDGTGFILFNDRETVRSPDAAFIRADRLRPIAEGFVPLAPDLAVEVLSPSDRMADALGKVAMYLEAGVSLVWLIDPPTRTVNIFRQDAAPMTLHESDVLDGGDVVLGFSVPVAEIFAE